MEHIHVFIRRLYLLKYFKRPGGIVKGPCVIPTLHFAFSSESVKVSNEKVAAKLLGKFCFL